MDLAARFEGFDKDQLTAAWHVYTDLARKKAWSLVEMLPCDSLRIAYLVAQEEKDSGKAQLVVPVLGQERLSLEDVSQLMKGVNPPVTGNIELSWDEGVVLAIVDTDSTVVYYRIQEGIVPPDGSLDNIAGLSEKEEKTKPRRRRQRGQKRKCPTERTGRENVTAES